MYKPKETGEEIQKNNKMQRARLCLDHGPLLAQNCGNCVSERELSLLSNI